MSQPWKQFQMTPAIRGQLTRAVNRSEVGFDTNQKHAMRREVASVFAKHMPREQAKHMARRYLIGQGLA